MQTVQPPCVEGEAGAAPSGAACWRMVSEPPSSCVDILHCGENRFVYRVTLPPEALPPVPIRALEQAWDAAHEAAVSSASARRCFSFRGADGRIAHFDLEDRDARHWAGAVDRVAGLASLGGISLCLRLLALVDLIANSPGAFGLMTRKRDGARLDRALLRAAARAELTADARFDEASLSRNLPGRPCSSAARQPFTGVSA